MNSLLIYCVFHLIFIPVSYGLKWSQQVRSKENQEKFEVVTAKTKGRALFVDYDSENYPKVQPSLKLFRVPKKKDKSLYHKAMAEALKIQNRDALIDFKENKGKGPASFKFPKESFQQSQKIDSHWSDLSAVNPHYTHKSDYSDFGRRFVFLYPYSENNQSAPHVAEDNENDIVQAFQKDETDVQQDLVPVEAPPEFVLAVAKQSALLEASKPVNPTDELIQKDILRSGNYWNAVWKEDVDPKKILRTDNKKATIQKKFQNSVKVNLVPERKIPEMLSILKQMSPRFLFVINNKDEKKYFFYYLRFVTL